MRANPIPFTGSGILQYASENVSAPQYLLGLSSTGFTSVKVYDGTDNTGELLLNATVNQTIALTHELLATTGVYIEVAGTGKGTLWLAS